MHGQAPVRIDLFSFHRTLTLMATTRTLLWMSGTCGSSSSLASPSSWSSAPPLWLICLTTGSWGVQANGMAGGGRGRGGSRRGLCQESCPVLLRNGELRWGLVSSEASSCLPSPMLLPPGCTSGPAGKLKSL